MRNVLACLAGSVLCLAALPAQGATILNLDMSETLANFATFHFDNNDVVAYPDVANINFSVEHGALAFGGDPGFRRYITNIMTPTGTGSIGVPLYMHSYTQYFGYSYTPSVSGVIDSITFSVEVKMNVDAGTFFNIYIGAASYSPETIAVSESDDYATVTATYSAADFAPGILSGASALQFGFGFETLTANTGATQTFMADFDNFVVRINEVPEPATVGILAVGALAWMRRRGK